MSKFIVIAALSENYRRAGLVFGTEPQEFKLGDFDETILQTLYADKNLTIKDAPQLVDNGLVEINEKLEETIESLTIELGQATGQIVSLEETIESLTIELGQATGQIVSLEETISDLKAKLAKPKENTRAK